MVPLGQILDYLETLAPAALAESWDNIGLLLGRTSGDVSRVMTCLTLTPDVAEEAVENSVDLIVSHHPILFRPVQSITDRTTEGEMLLRLIQADIAAYSPHTAYDSALDGINQQLARLLDLSDIVPIRPLDREQTSDPQLIGLGSGRIGTLAESIPLSGLIEIISERIPSQAGIQYVGDLDRIISRVGIACGSAAEFMGDAKKLEADVLLTGEARFHSCLEARSRNISLVIPGHYATERPGIERLASLIHDTFPNLEVTPSQRENDPLTLWQAP